MSKSCHLSGRYLLSLLVAVFCLSICPRLVSAHAQGENYIWVNVEQDHLSGRFEIHLNDLKKKLGIDWKEYGTTPEEGVAATAEQVQKYLVEHFQIVFDQPVELQFTEVKIFDEKFAQYYYTSAQTKIPDRFTIHNDIFITRDDPLHRSLIVFEYNKKLGKEYGEENAIMSFGRHNPVQELDLNNLPALLQPWDFIWQGILHIWIGLDHILFLLALLLLTVMRWDQDNKNFEPVPDFKKALWNVLKIVTIFTIAHSVTLSLAAFDVISLRSRIVESLIALSIVIVALNNVFPKFNDRTWLIIFFFGLFHGMGFATVMGVLPFRTVNLTQILLSFNVGVELGQLVIVAMIFPVLYMLRNTKLYRPIVLIGGSLVICVIASFWFLERAFAL